jgi:hypothetical protein
MVDKINAGWNTVDIHEYIIVAELLYQSVMKAAGCGNRVIAAITDEYSARHGPTTRQRDCSSLLTYVSLLVAACKKPSFLRWKP